ncbi:hypothetical protein ACP2W0_19335, partial [Pseudobacillus badius]|uniref:hypothetical protein n=1 Tax=Bacillus badius TaxID=1455 RepID=UPI003CF3B427
MGKQRGSKPRCFLVCLFEQLPLSARLIQKAFINNFSKKVLTAFSWLGILENVAEENKQLIKKQKKLLTFYRKLDKIIKSLDRDA